MRDPSRVRVDGPLAAYADGFRVELAQQGYSGSTVAQHLQLLGHLSRWLAVRGLDGRAATPELVGAYLVQRRAAGYASLRSRRGLAPLLDYLRRYAGAPRAVPVERDPVERVLLRYAGFLETERGLVQSTIRRNVELVRPFLTGRVRADGDDLCGLTAGDVTAFVTAACQGARSRDGVTDGDRFAVPAAVSAYRRAHRSAVG